MIQHFFADDRNAQQAEFIAGTWALAFTEQAQADVAAQEGLNEFIRLDAAQVENLPVSRSVSMGMYLLSFSIGFLTLSALLVLFVKFRV